jgi:hypothetical protein
MTVYPLLSSKQRKSNCVYVSPGPLIKSGLIYFFPVGSVTIDCPVIAFLQIRRLTQKYNSIFLYLFLN